MLLKIDPISIDVNDPFDNDKLNREPEVDNLTTLIKNLNTPSVLAIDSAWGTGKTTFIKMWEACLQNEGVHTLYFNAWATDFSEDPLVSFLGEMNDGLSSLIGSSDEAKKAWTKTTNVAKQIARRGGPAIVKILTAGVIDADKVIEEEIEKALGSLSGDALEHYLKQKAAITSFHDSLTDLMAQTTDDQPVVIFVDELDRCKPTYAILLLERIKHLFDIEGLVFVLSIAKTQLSHSISAVYGKGFDANNYLRRFIDLEYNLRLPEIDQYIDSLFDALALDAYFAPRKKYSQLKYDEAQLKEVFKLLARSYELILREIEQVLSRINLALRTAKEKEYVFPALLVFLVVVKNKSPELYGRYTSVGISEKEMVEHLHSIIPEKERLEIHSCALLEGLLIGAKHNKWSNSDSEVLNQHKKRFSDDSVGSVQRRYSEAVIEYASGINAGVDLGGLIARIEMVSQFQLPRLEG